MKNMSKIEMLKLYIWTLGYFRPFLLHTVIYIICGGLMIWGELMIPLKMGYLIDHVLPSKNIVELKFQILLLCVIVVLILLFKIIYNFLEQIISNKIVKNQQIDLINKLYELGFSYYEKVPTGEILSLFENSVRETQRTYTFLFPHFIYAFAQFIVPSIVLMKEQPIFFIAAMIGNIIYMFLNNMANKKILYYLDLETKAAQISQQSFYDVITAKKEVVAMGSHDWLIRKTMGSFSKFRKPRMWSIFWRHFRYTTVGLTLTISIIFFYFFGLKLLMVEKLLLGEFIGYSFLMGIISRGFSVFFYIIPSQLQALNYAQYLHEFMNLKPDVENSDDNAVKSFDNDIVVENISFYYTKNQPVIKNVSFSIPAGKKVAIVGESGSGKSTILKLIARFYDVNQGQITIGNHDIKSIDINCLREYVGCVFQETYLFNVSIKENIRFGKPEATDDQIIEAAKFAGAHKFIMDTENGYNTVTGERGVLLSGGQKQRISIARTILKDPQILLLDEATSALDHVTENYIKDAIYNLSSDKTIITVAHRLSTIIDYDHILCFDSGRVAEEGTYQELMNKKGIFYKLVMRGNKNDR